MNCVPYNPLVSLKKYDLDYLTGTIRVVEDGSTAVILIVSENGEQTVLNIVNYER